MLVNSSTNTQWVPESIESKVPKTISTPTPALENPGLENPNSTNPSSSSLDNAGKTAIPMLLDHDLLVVKKLSHDSGNSKAIIPSVAASPIDKNTIIHVMDEEIMQGTLFSNLGSQMGWKLKSMSFGRKKIPQTIHDDHYPQFHQPKRKPIKQ
ncbi:hypothetical protein ACH5RR_040924 [Cinchona calisaya]|uniref:Uncharacterized protein n=1 Tax=Cinchona calisaya TaxID=153742 RepID=A0ABD2XSL8_9GENT